MKVIIDRIEGGYAVAEMPSMEYANIPLALLPGVKEGDVVIIEVDRDETEGKKASARERFNKLRA